MVQNLKCGAVFLILKQNPKSEKNRVYSFIKIRFIKKKMCFVLKSFVCFKHLPNV